MELIDKDKRDGYIYDVVIKQYDTQFWKTTTGTPAVASNKLRFTSAAAASYILHRYGDFEFAVNVPTTPSAGEAKHWGLRAPATDSIGAIYFEIVGAVFQAVTIDDGGTSETTTLTWAAGYTAVETKFRIIWEPDIVRFMINGVIVATHVTRVPSNSLPLRIVNSDADNVDVGYVQIRQAAAIV